MTELAPQMKVLVVDDNTENLFTLQALLHKDNVEIVLAHSAAEALIQLQLHDISLALLDIQMPRIDGYQLATMMRAADRTRRIPILFLTAGAVDRSDSFRADDAGSVEFLLRPVDCRTLRRKTDAILLRQRL